MVGVDVQLSVNLKLFTPEDISDKESQMTVRENMSDFAQNIGEILMSELGRTELDNADVEVEMIHYINEDELEVYYEDYVDE